MCCFQELCSCQTVILSVEDEVGQRIIIEDLLETTRSADPSLRQAAVTILNAYFARTRLDYSLHTRSLLSGLIRLLNDSNPEVLSQSWDTISSITKVCWVWVCCTPVMKRKRQSCCRSLSVSNFLAVVVRNLTRAAS